MSQELPCTIERFTEVWRGNDGAELLSVIIEYPVLNLCGTPARKINAYYTRRNNKFAETCKKILLTRSSETSNTPLKVTLTTRITFIGENLVSLLNLAEFGGAAKSRVCADLWSLESGAPLPYTSLFPEVRNPKRHILNLVRSEIERQPERGFRTFYPGALKRLRSAFSVQNIFLNSQGKAVILFPRGSIASDVCEFVIN
ncbi:MAG: hypothetical protein LBT88_03460 [Oscillospiraceae bacterium]|jgi:hypothetical protein|nr:hypothetical protein [Oscillospiraceae bacterium]